MSSQKKRIGLVGYGFISGKGHVPAFLKRPDVELVAIADICPARLQLASRELPGVRLYGGWEELLARESDLDILDIAAPPYVHAEVAIAALNRGMHVLCEKPLAMGTAEARAMVQAARDSQRVLFPCHNYKHAPVVKLISETIRSGRIGELSSVMLQTFRNTHAKGVAEWNTDWRREFRFGGGGITMDHGSHSFYLTFDWLASFPVALTAKTLKLSERWDTEDNLTVTLEFPGRRYAHAVLSWTAGMRKVVYTLQGSKGAIMVNDDEAEISVGFPNTGSHSGSADYRVERLSIASDWMDASHTKWFNSMFDKFLGCIERGDFMNSELRESYACVEVMEKCFSSSRDSSREIPLRCELAP